MLQPEKTHTRYHVCQADVTTQNDRRGDALELRRAAIRALRARSGDLDFQTHHRWGWTMADGYAPTPTPIRVESNRGISSLDP
jgi:hypothetical protein